MFNVIYNEGKKANTHLGDNKATTPWLEVDTGFKKILKAFWEIIWQQPHASESCLTF